MPSNFVKSPLPLSPVAPLYIVYRPKYRLYNPIKVLFRSSVFKSWFSQWFSIKPCFKVHLVHFTYVFSAEIHFYLGTWTCCSITLVR